MKQSIRLGLPIAAIIIIAGVAVFALGHAKSTAHLAQSTQAGQAAHGASSTTKAPDPPPARDTAAKAAPAAASAAATGTKTTTQDPPPAKPASHSAGSADGAPKLSATPGLIYAHGIVSTPQASHPYFLQRAAASGGKLEYGITRNHGLFVSTDGGQTWQERSNGLPLRVIYPFTNDPIDTLTSLGVDPIDGTRVAVTTETGIYLSENAGKSWQSIPVQKPIKSPDFLTAVALSPFDHSTIAVGTSFDGVFVTSDLGKNWVHRAKELTFIYQGAGFYEEISGLAYSVTSRGAIYLGVGFGGGVYRSSSDWQSWQPLSFPEKGNGVILNLNLHTPHPQPASWGLAVTTQQKRWLLDTASGQWTDRGATPQPPPQSKAAQARMKAASGRAGIYISPWQAEGKKLDHWISFLKKNGLNTLVVDVKDDHGHITYDTKVPLAHTLGAVHPYFNIQQLIKTAHENGIYVVGRLVVFKDEFLYRYEHHRYAIWDPKRDAPWGHFVKEVDKKTGEVTKVQKEFWVDPFSEFAWRYNLSIAEELQRDGIDEIQFDYIRFPSEQSSRNALYRYRRPGMSQENALESFLKMARGKLSVPIAVDLFGYNSWYPITGWVGQDIEVYSNYADVICPMFYPSLFPRDFLKEMPYLKRARYLYRRGTWRSQRIVDGRAIIRPFVQAFLLGSYELKMDKAEYSTYLRTQLEGLQEAHATGFLLWNFGTDYYMVTFPLNPYAPSRPGGGG